ncbi:MAG: succinate dehydrogenase, hydrophobic membrane anchor protein [Burkholderiaceae bacterium]|jgi:succinate dehydrogenase / fumarate reductase membrane anchor subunit|nr:succinate dehydrogenase, hydrophobic membrane anchor protein [Burkholderiaceae bacterium]
MRVFSGQRAWLLQRFSAIAILILLVLGIVRMAVTDGSAYDRWHAIATSAHGAVLILAFFMSMALHGWIGVRDVVLDYVHAPALRLPLLAVIAFILVAVQIRVAMILLGQP